MSQARPRTPVRRSSPVLAPSSGNKSGRGTPTRGFSQHTRASPVPRVASLVPPLSTTTPVRSTAKPSGIVTTPRVAHSPRGAGVALSHREVSATQKSLNKKEHDAMTARIEKIMATPKPVPFPNGFRITASSDADLKLAHTERVMRDPERSALGIRVAQSKHLNRSNMVGILATTPQGCLGPEKAAENDNKIAHATRQHYTPKASVLSNNYVPPRSAPLGKRTSSREPAEAPWEHVLPEKARRPATRTSSPIAFDPHAPLSTPRRSFSADNKKNFHHDVFNTKEVLTPRPHSASRSRTLIDIQAPSPAGLKKKTSIDDETARQPKIELPPRKPPQKKPLHGPEDNDLFNREPFADDHRVGRRLQSALLVPTSSNPNQIAAKATLSERPPKRFTEPMEHRDPSPASRRNNPVRNQSSISFGAQGLQSDAGKLLAARRPHSPTRSRQAERNENQQQRLAAGPSPNRRFCHSPVSSMRDIMSWN